MKTACLVDSHADGLRLFGDLPEGEEQADLLSVVQKQAVTGGLGFQESLQSLDGLFHLVETIKHFVNRPTNSSFHQWSRTHTCCCATVS